VKDRNKHDAKYVDILQSLTANADSSTWQACHMIPWRCQRWW